MLCTKGAAILQSKSNNVEGAANEHINMLCITKEEDEDDDDNEDESSRPEGEQQEMEGMEGYSLLLLVLIQKISFNATHNQNRYILCITTNHIHPI